LANPQVRLVVTGSSTRCLLHLGVISQPRTSFSSTKHAVGLSVYRDQASSRAKPVVKCGAFTPVSSVVECTLEPGTYSIVCATFQPGVERPFFLSVASDSPVELARIDMASLPPPPKAVRCLLCIKMCCYFQ
jgi:hypothetical protein